MSSIFFYLLNISKIAAKLLKNYEMAKDFSLSIIKVIKIKCKMGIICGKYCNFAPEFK